MKMLDASSVFRAYDIRGRVDDPLTESLVYAIGAAIASLIKPSRDRMVVGRDGRLSSPRLAKALCAGICSTGVSVVDVGEVTSPMLYFATHHLGIDSGVMVTGSHNPKEDNGLKIVMQGETQKKEGIQAIYACVRAGEFAKGQGDIQQQSIEKAYHDAICERIVLPQKMKVIVDAGHGIAGAYAPRILQSLGCEVIPLYCDVDGHFPHHHPDPNRPENLRDCQQQMLAHQADIAIAFDGDGDRLGVVANDGQIIWPDRQMMAFSDAVLAKHPGAPIVYDVKCSMHLGKVIAKAGGQPVMWRTGHSVLKAKMKALGAPLAGEMSGHIFFEDDWYGFDDGLFAGLRLMAYSQTLGQDVAQLFAQYPQSVATPELIVPVPESRKFDYVAEFAEQARFPGAELVTIDGVRVHFEQGWGLLRASNTSASLTLRFEADTKEALTAIQHAFQSQMQQIEPKLSVM